MSLASATIMSRFLAPVSAPTLAKQDTNVQVIWVARLRRPGPYSSPPRPTEALCAALSDPHNGHENADHGLDRYQAAKAYGSEPAIRPARSTRPGSDTGGSFGPAAPGRQRRALGGRCYAPYSRSAALRSREFRRATCAAAMSSDASTSCTRRQVIRYGDRSFPSRPRGD